MYYFRQSLWSTKPMVKLFTTNTSVEENNIIDQLNECLPVWDGNENEEIVVVCFTNCPRTELFLNNRSVGVKEIRKTKDGFLTWRIPYEKGELKAVSIDSKGNTHTCLLRTTGKAERIRLTPVDEVLHANGRDMTHIVAEVVDSQGNLICRARDVITLAVEGNGYLMGLENGDLQDTTPYTKGSRMAYNGKLLIYIGAGVKKGTIHVRACTGRLKSAEICLECI